MFFLLSRAFDPECGLSPRLRRATVILVVLNALPWRFTAYLSAYVDGIPTVLMLGLWMMLAALPAAQRAGQARAGPVPATV